MRRVVVTGIGILSSVGNDPASFFDSLLCGRSGVVPLGGEGPREARRVGARVAFDPLDHFDPTRAAAIDRFSQFALVAAAQAIGDARLVLPLADRSRIGVAMGTGLGGAQTIDASYLTLHRHGSRAVRPLTVPMAMNAAGASHIARAHGLEGPNLTFSTACSSSAVAIGEALRAIRHGYVDVMIAGGAEALLTDGVLTAWEAMRVLAPLDVDDPGGSCRPFSGDRAGLVLGEGAAFVVLEAADHASARGARCRAEIMGYGATNDPAHLVRPSIDGQARAMKAALADARLAPGDVDCINAHGTAMPAGDRVETAAIKCVFGERAYRIPVSATKSMHGHMMGATAAAELIATVLSIEHDAVPPTANLRVPDPECDLDYVAEGARIHAGVQTAMTNSFAFGGSSGVLIVRAAT